MIKNFPRLKAGSNVNFDISPLAFERWNPGIRAAAEDDNTISIYDVIGENPWSEGVTAKRISGALARIGSDNPVTVNINSPGGDLFEGNAIYNLLRQHRGEVTVNVISLAASAASLIAMGAGEGKLQIARSGFFMIHNAWTLAIGDRNDLRSVADFLEPLDRAMADVYSLRTGEGIDEISEMMNVETWLGGSDAIDQGFADNYIPADQIEEGQGQAAAAAMKLDVALAKAGLSRGERRKLLAEYNRNKSSTPSAADSGKPSAADKDTPSAVDLSKTVAAATTLKHALRKKP